MKQHILENGESNGENTTLGIQDLGDSISGYGVIKDDIEKIMGNNKDDFKFYSNDLLQKLGVEGTKQGFFVNIKQRKVISEKGLKYKNKMYYTLDELPDGFYNVEYEDKNTESPQIGNIETMSLDANSWKFIVSDIKYGGYVNKGQVFYKKDGAENWEKTESDYFVVSEPGKYDVKVVDVAGNESEIQKKETNPADSPECWEKIYNPEPLQWYSYGNSNVNEPKLKGNMTPIRYIGVVAEGANTTNNWANAITADGSMWVWIPRYAYKITYYTDSNYTTTTTNKTQYGKIDVAFVKYENGQNMFLNSTDSGEITSDPTEVGAGTEKWLVHPAFINDSSNNFANGGWDRELSGIWVGKFEATGTKIKDSDGNVTEATISVMPGVSALRDMKIKDQFKYAKLATFGESVSAENLGSHMAKNSEWGATVYLAYSKYGTNGYDVGKNSSSSNYTGGTNTQTNIYSTNYGQSTTNNPYGVYDLRGGSYEYVASYVNYGSSDSYLSIYGGTTSGDLYGSSDEQSTSTKYKTVYTASGTSESDSYNLLVTGNTTKKGDAVYETSTNYQNSTSWNNGTGNSADSYFPHVTHSFFIRGGDSSYQHTGMFSFGNNAGHSFNVYSFRLILCL
ncbi:MAG TPA: hypothetical protein OIM60_06585 [Clostridiaceae bacterium]|jgi:hypothetical protein|nr:hypothetical protein [Clostridiaceae bacterium]